jgi:hypothetical protein
MPKVKVNDITVNYESQGTGEPLVLIPYLAADYSDPRTHETGGLTDGRCCHP